MSEGSEYRVTPGEQGIRLDVFAAGLPGIESRSAAVHRIEAGEVLLNGATTTKKRILLSGDLVSYIPTTPKADVSTLIPQYIPLDIRFEDEHLIVLSKQAGLVCHPSPGHESGTLANALLAHCGVDHLGMLQGMDRPGIVHRLDRDTTGLMLAAKSDTVQAALQDAIRMRTVDRRYLTLVHGYVAPDTGLVDAPIARDTRDRLRMAVSDDPGARSSVTTFTVLERFEAGRFDDGYTLIECKLYTGRTHQIRVHMAYINHPCVGDPLYGVSSRGAHADLRCEMGLDRQFLHSYRIEFDHPVTGEHLSFTDSLPDDLAEPLASRTTFSMGATETGVRILGGLAALSNQSL
jgi:23S rRNA pseudouridine1911/1915/1917 synthase